VETIGIKVQGFDHAIGSLTARLDPQLPAAMDRFALQEIWF
jgi:hypothetical protein